MIRDKFYKEIAKTIDNHSRFDSSDFKIEPTKGQNNSVTLTVTFGIKPEYKIVFKVPNSTSSDKSGYGAYYAFSGTVCPGPLAYEESFSFLGEEGVYDRIASWLTCIWEELSSHPIVRLVESQQKQIDDIFDKFENIGDGFFTVEEVMEIKKRLDKLEETLKSEIQNNSEDKKSSEQEIAKLHSDIDTLKQTINSFNKKGWVKSFTSKVFKWTKNSENRKLVTDGYKIIRELLPEHVKTSLPELPK